MDEGFSRNIPAITAREQALLGQKRVLIAGCGGLGGYLCELLTRLGVGHIRAVDEDVFDESNRNRQLLCISGSVGQSKAEAARQRALAIDPGVDFESFHVRLTAENARALLEGCDAALDGLDNVESRLVLEQACAERGIPLIHGAVNGWAAQAAVVPPGSGLLALLYAKAEPAPSPAVLSFTAALCASIQATETTKLLCGREVTLWGKLWLYDGLSGESETIKLISCYKK